jgi:hypothetical protein
MGLLTGVHVASVERRPTLWRITDDEGVRWATKDAWLASLADRYRESRQTVRLMGPAGWYYRSLEHIEPVQETTP